MQEITLHIHVAKFILHFNQSALTVQRPGTNSRSELSLKVGGKPEHPRGPTQIMQTSTQKGPGTPGIRTRNLLAWAVHWATMLLKKSKTNEASISQYVLTSSVRPWNTEY